jgi:hypothetical protein
MKYLLIFLISFSVQASVKSDLESLGVDFSKGTNEGEGDIRMHMHKCGFNDSNMKVFMRDLINNNDTVKAACLVSKKSEVDTEVNNAEQARASRRLDLDNLKAKQNNNENLSNAEIQKALKYLLESL